MEENDNPNISSESAKKTFSLTNIIAVVAIGGILLILMIMFNTSSKEDGRLLYETHCMNCHGKNGEGLKNLIPPLAQSDFLKANFGLLPCIIRHGIKDSIYVNGTLYSQVMPPNDKLSDIEIANLVNYIHREWHETQPSPTPQSIDEDLKNCSLTTIKLTH